MSDPRASTVPFVRSVRDQHGDRIVVGFAPPPDVCDCAACKAHLQAATTVTKNADEVSQ